MDPTADLTEWDVSFEMNKAKAYTKMYEKDVLHNVEYINMAIESFKVALALDSNIHEANFNIATAYYNQGVYKVRRIDANTEFDSLIVIQDQCIQLFLKARPYMMKAYELHPRHKDTLRGLWFINRALSDDEQAEFYRGELERNIKNGTIEEGELPGNK
jgi:tetratricopeptide (TPR) repeat protein